LAGKVAFPAMLRICALTFGWTAFLNKLLPWFTASAAFFHECFAFVLDFLSSDFEAVSLLRFRHLNIATIFIHFIHLLS
jgi:hypothetical protein